jgi:hypothetical protein
VAGLHENKMGWTCLKGAVGNSEAFPVPRNVEFNLQPGWWQIHGKLFQQTDGPNVETKLSG